MQREQCTEHLRHSTLCITVHSKTPYDSSSILRSCHTLAFDHFNLFYSVPLLFITAELKTVTAVSFVKEILQEGEGSLTGSSVEDQISEIIIFTFLLHIQVARCLHHSRKGFFFFLLPAYYYGEIIITKTYLYNCDPLKPHFYIVKLGFTGVYIIFLITA